MLTRLLARLKTIDVARRQSGQVIVLFAVFIIVLMVLAGSAYDYASIVVDDARLQNAVDAAVLAGSDSLALNSSLAAGTPAVIAQSTALAYLAQNGVATATPGTNVIMTFPTSTPVGANAPSSVIESMTLNVSRNHPTAFWPLIGVNSVNLHGNGGAHAQHNMLDVVLSLDTTGSLSLSNNLQDIAAGKTGTTVRDAMTAFVNQMNPTSGDDRGPKIGVGRYAGVKCTWVDSTGAGHTGTTGKMDVYSTTNPQSEYRTPCVDDDTVLTPLSNDKSLLLTIANGGSGCPAVAAGYACPLQHKGFTLSGELDLDGVAILPVGPYYTGTKEPNALCLVNPDDGLCTENPPGVDSAGFAWSTANGGRNCTAWPCPSNQIARQARRVQVIMTDGQDEAWPTAYVAPGTTDRAFPESIATYDANFKALATNLKANPAPDGGPPVEVFVVGYFCTDNPTFYDSTQFPPSSFCASKLAYTASPRVCPGPNYTIGSTGSPIDDLLVGVSSSKPGTCDHYFPMPKNENLSTLFADLAGTISRGQLTQ